MPDIREARTLFPATERLAYFNTATVGLASQALAAAYHGFVDDWTASGLDYMRAEAAGETARAVVAALIGAKASDLALIASVSAAAGLVAAQFGAGRPGQNVVIGECEFSSNHFPWRLLCEKGYEVRQVPFRNGGLEPDEVAEEVDSGTQLVAFSGVQTASGHRSDIRAISGLAREVGAIVFVDGSQMVGALPVRHELDSIDVLATLDSKFLLHAGRGLGYCYFSPEMQQRLTPINAGWKAGQVPTESLFGPTMNLSAHRLSVRQLDQLAGRDWQRGGPVDVRPLRRGSHLRTEPRSCRKAAIRAGGGGLGARRSTYPEPQQHRVGASGRPTAIAGSHRTQVTWRCSLGPRRQPSPRSSLLQPRR